MDLNVLKRFLNHSASEEDYKKINKWRREEPANSTFLFSLEEIWSKKEEANYATKIHLNASYQKMIEKMMSRSESKIKEQETYNTTQKNDIHKPKSSLFLKITASIAIVLSVGLGTLYYMEVTRPVGFNTVIVPNSQTANLVLEDGTHIWLNSGSRFTYPTKFARGYRTVKLAGEALFQGAGMYNIRFNEVFSQMFFNNGNLPAYFFDRWHLEDSYDPDNTNWVPGKWPANRFSQEMGSSYRDSQAWNMKASYLRLKSFEVGYILPRTFTKKYGVENLRLYFNAYNLFTFTDSFLKQFDPEKTEGDYGAGYNYPLTKSFNVGLSVSF